LAGWFGWGTLGVAKKYGCGSKLSGKLRGRSIIAPSIDLRQGLSPSQSTAVSLPDSHCLCLLSRPPHATQPLPFSPANTRFPLPSAPPLLSFSGQWAGSFRAALLAGSCRSRRRRATAGPRAASSSAAPSASSTTRAAPSVAVPSLGRLFGK
jgi:hypothetical protein